MTDRNFRTTVVACERNPHYEVMFEVTQGVDRRGEEADSFCFEVRAYNYVRQVWITSFKEWSYGHTRVCDSEITDMFSQAWEAYMDMKDFCGISATSTVNMFVLREGA